MDQKCIKAYWKVPQELFACVYDPSTNTYTVGKEGKKQHQAAQLYSAKLFGDVMMAYDALRENPAAEAAFEETLKTYNEVRDALEKRLVYEQCAHRIKNVELCLNAFFL
jgi:hypothetical protein